MPLTYIILHAANTNTISFSCILIKLVLVNCLNTHLADKSDIVLSVLSLTVSLEHNLLHS